MATRNSSEGAVAFTRRQQAYPDPSADAGELPHRLEIRSSTGAAPPAT